MTFKANIDDTRDSLSFKLAKLIRFYGGEVICSDAFVSNPSFVSVDELLDRADVVIIGAAHNDYEKIKIPPEKELIDPWGIIKAAQLSQNVVPLSHYHPSLI